MSWKKIPGYIWALPLTLLAFIYVGLMVLTRQYKWQGIYGDAFVFKTRQTKMISLMKKIWRGWAGHAFGQVVVVKYDTNFITGFRILCHEREHVNQCIRFGIFQPIFFVFMMFVLWLTRHGHPYYDNPFEIAARRSAGQEVDYMRKPKC